MLERIGQHLDVTRSFLDLSGGMREGQGIKKAADGSWVCTDEYRT